MTPPDHIGKYVDLNLVGFGTYGSVYKAWDPDLNRYVAIKVMNAQFSQDEGSLARFQSEARFMARVDQHPNVVRVIELGEEERGLYSNGGHCTRNTSSCSHTFWSGDLVVEPAP